MPSAEGIGCSIGVMVAEFFTGRSAYLCDPEGNYFEITWAGMPDNPIIARRVTAT
jgi:hypothetical protein